MSQQGRRKTKNDDAWETLFETYNIVDAVNNYGFFEIRASQINEFRQSRLMAKIDSASVLPQIFIDNKFSILPITRSSYLIGRFSLYFSLEHYLDLKTAYKSISFPSDIESIDYGDLYSEAASLACAYNAKIIDEVVGEPVRWTLMGRMSTGDFSFSISDSVNPKVNYLINVSKSQCEIDGGFESENFLVIIEAKNISLNDFLIRQLYYPYRKWTSIIKSKQVIPIFMTYTDETFTFYTFKFDDIANYNSIRLQNIKSYKIAPEEIYLADVSEAFEKTIVVDEPDVVFPQANRFDNVLNLLIFLRERPRTREDIGEFLSVVDRQAKYHVDAARYLGLAEKVKIPETKSIVYRLTKAGLDLLSKKHKARYLEAMKLIFSRRVFYESFEMMSELGDYPSEDAIAELIEKYTHLKGTTPGRRANSVRGWLKWILNQVVE